jgi:hypothetical protein
VEINKLIEKLRLIEALHARPASEGERMAADFARQRILERIRQAGASRPPIEFKFTLNNHWSRRLLLALLRRYDITPYRYPRQRHTTVMAKVSEKFVSETLWPEFVELDKALTEHLDSAAETIIRESFAADCSEATVVGQIGHEENASKGGASA